MHAHTQSTFSTRILFYQLNHRHNQCVVFFISKEETLFVILLYLLYPNGGNILSEHLISDMPYGLNINNVPYRLPTIIELTSSKLSITTAVTCSHFRSAVPAMLILQAPPPSWAWRTGWPTISSPASAHPVLIAAGYVKSMRHDEIYTHHLNRNQRNLASRCRPHNRGEEQNYTNVESGQLHGFTTGHITTGAAQLQRTAP